LRVAHELRRRPGTRQVKASDGKDELTALRADLAGDQRKILMRKALSIANRPPDSPLALCLSNGVVRTEAEAKRVVQFDRPRVVESSNQDDGRRPKVAKNDIPANTEI